MRTDEVPQSLKKGKKHIKRLYKKIYEYIFNDINVGNSFSKFIII